MSPPGSGRLPVGDSLCCAAMFHLVTAAWAFSSFPQARAFTSLYVWLHLLFDFFLFVQSLSGNLYASFNWLSLSKAQVGNDCG